MDLEQDTCGSFALSLQTHISGQMIIVMDGCGQTLGWEDQGDRRREEGDKGGITGGNR